MRRAAVAGVLLLVLPVLAHGQARPTTGSAEQTLMDIERRWAATQLKGDGATLATIVASNWTGITPEGAVVTRAQAIEVAKSAKFAKSEVSDMKVLTLNPTTAVVTGVWRGIRTGPEGEKVDTSERWTDVFVNQDGTWRCVASQNTTIQK